MYTIFLVREGDEDENIQVDSTDNQSDSIDNLQNTEIDNACTPVYTETGEYTCAEYLVIENDLTQTVEIEKTEEQIEYDENILSTLETIKENQETVIKSTDTTELIEIYEEINEQLQSLNSYLNIMLGLYFIAWIISTFNTWRRSNKN